MKSWFFPTRSTKIYEICKHLSPPPKVAPYLLFSGLLIIKNASAKKISTMEEVWKHRRKRLHKYWFVEEVHSDTRMEDFIRFQNTSKLVKKILGFALYFQLLSVFENRRKSSSYSCLNYYFEAISADKMLSLQYNRIKQFFVC